MKRIILCLDGTWNHNRAKSSFTNVLKLAQSILASDSNGIQQVCHYVEGIASADGEWLQFLKGGVGYGVSDRIRKAYAILVEAYEPGDEIFLVGFSRGAFEARSLGALITLFGIAKPGSAFAMANAWSVYRNGKSKRDPAALAEIRAGAHYPVPIKCVAVWDTVGNLGNPFVAGGLIARSFRFHDMRLSPNIEVALHALSIDELRGPFRPLLWTLPKGQAPAAHQHVEQVWFAGTHADVGGGHRETALSDTALLWMAERLQAKTGLALDMHKLGHMTRPDALGAQHSVAEGRIFSWSGLFPFIRLIKQAVDGIPPLRRALVGAWRSNKLSPEVETVNESIHESVAQRFGERVIELRYGRSRPIHYRPGNLVPVMEQPRLSAMKATTGEPRRVKIFTVHGTFAHETDWDNWERSDDEKKQQRSS